MPSASSISADETTSGGTKRTTSAPAGTSSRPLSEAAWTNLAAPPSSGASSRPSSNPRPRTSATFEGCFAAMAARPALSCAPRAAALATRPSSSIAAATARPAAHAKGLPPYVVAWSPGAKTLAASLQSIAPSGTPPPTALAHVRTSGLTPRCWCAQSLPVRPTPAWTSSNTSKAPLASQSSRAFWKNAASPTRTPPSPWTGSIKTAATSCSANAASNDAASLKSKCAARPGTRQQASGPWYLGCAVAEMVAMVRPWNEPYAVRILGCLRPRVVTACFRLSLMAASFASPPELQKNALSRPGVLPTSQLASAPWLGM
mmetsp:Transcript_31237/g.93752  ORF Transcript_31237/g.93752 Transcript_31237/m.93752 type:complete len:317 (+) Transcript_31237:80-1030(+)